MQIICIKIISNSNLKLLDSQLKAIDKQYNVPFSYLKAFKSGGYQKIWIEQKDFNPENRKWENGELIAKQLGGLIYIQPSYKNKISESQLNDIQPIKNPKRQGEDLPEEELRIEVQLENIICIKLTADDGSLSNIADYWGLDASWLLECKSVDLHKIWVQLGQEESVCWIGNQDLKEVTFNKVYLPMTSKVRKAILSKEPVKTPKKGAKRITKLEQTISSQIVSQNSLLESHQTSSTTSGNKVSTKLSLDAILDKISLTGLNSLTPEERAYLDSISKG